MPSTVARAAVACPAADRDDTSLAVRSAIDHPRRIGIALFLAGFATFSLIYCTQPLLPEFAAEFAIGPAESSLAISLTTGSLAVSILCASAVSEAVGRRGLMFVSIALAALCNIFAAITPGWGWLLAARTAEGFVLGGVPAVAMAYLAEEVPPARLGLMMGIYVSGTAFGGMMGRVATGALAEALSWRGALVTVGLVDLAVALVFLALLPRSRNFVVRKGMRARAHLGAWYRHLRNPLLSTLFLVGFLALGAFMAVYNYIGFRLSASPYDLDSAQIGLIFFAYLGGVAASSLAGALADRMGRGPVMLAGALVFLAGLLLTLISSLGVIIVGILFVTMGFFMVHAIASGWVGRLAGLDKGHAASLYLLSYYAGASLLGSAGGFMWRGGGWPATVSYCAGLVGLVALVAFFLLRVNADVLKPAR